MIKVIICGGREFNDYQHLKEVCEYVLCDVWDEVEIVSGCASGADSLGERLAKENEFKIHKFPADWNKHDRAAGPIRNREMADFLKEDGNSHNCVIAFPGGRGTDNMVKTAEKLGLTVYDYR